MELVQSVLRVSTQLLFHDRIHTLKWELLSLRKIIYVITMEYSSSSIGTTAHCGLWPVEQCPSVFFPICHQLCPSSHSQHLKISSASSFHLFLGLPLLLVPSTSWVKIFLGILSSSILSRWPNQPLQRDIVPTNKHIYYTEYSSLMVS